MDIIECRKCKPRVQWHQPMHSSIGRLQDIPDTCRGENYKSSFYVFMISLIQEVECSTNSAGQGRWGRMRKILSQYSGSSSTQIFALYIQSQKDFRSLDSAGIYMALASQTPTMLIAIAILNVLCLISMGVALVWNYYLVGFQYKDAFSFFAISNQLVSLLILSVPTFGIIEYRLALALTLVVLWSSKATMTFKTGQRLTWKLDTSFMASAFGLVLVGLAFGTSAANLCRVDLVCWEPDCFCHLPSELAIIGFLTCLFALIRAYWQLYEVSENPLVFLFLLNFASFNAVLSSNMTAHMEFWDYLDHPGRYADPSEHMDYSGGHIGMVERGTGWE
ncbi:hypothetical protein BJ912DRAFT_925768 [Pholiota molesta]|nr:hypothetical protein BJ912DRAFT_925768 [Pholiota molesta]